MTTTYRLVIDHDADTATHFYRVEQWEPSHSGLADRWKLLDCGPEAHARKVYARCIAGRERFEVVEMQSIADEPADDYAEAQAERHDLDIQRENQDLRDAGRGHLCRP
jgi:hypothetical protein